MDATCDRPATDHEIQGYENRSRERGIERGLPFQKAKFLDGGGFGMISYQSAQWIPRSELRPPRDDGILCKTLWIAASLRSSQ